MAGETERIVVSENGLSLPVIEVLTGRGAIFGKSGSGKSNTASVVVEELLETGFPVLIVDIEGEYRTLSDRYDVVTVGDGDQYDHALFDIDPGQIVDLCLDQHRPVVVDISAVLEIERAERVITDTLQLLFSREKDENNPFLVIVEEIHEFLPQQGGLGDLGDMLIRIAKRGRKRGLGLLGMSQRPASVDKNFITQCDWLIFHRLTWENDTRVVKSILGSEYAEDVKDLPTGSAFMLADWEETVREVRFRRKKTSDAGTTPSLSTSERRDLTSSTGSVHREPVPTDVESSKVEADSSEEEDDESTSEPETATSEKATSVERGSSEPSATTEEPTKRNISTAITGTNPRSDQQPVETSRTAATMVEPATGDDADSDSGPEDPAAETLWELGQFVTYVLVRALGRLSYSLRVGYARLMGHSKPADRLGPLAVEDADGRPAPSRFALRIFWFLLLIIGLLIVFALVSL